MVGRKISYIWNNYLSFSNSQDHAGTDTKLLNVFIATITDQVSQYKYVSKLKNIEKNVNL